MSSSHFAAVNIVPLIARVVLCAAFLPAGYQKLFDRAPIDAAQAARLEAMGWGWRPPSAEGAATGATESAATRTPVVSPGSMRDDQVKKDDKGATDKAGAKDDKSATGGSSTDAKQTDGAPSGAAKPADAPPIAAPNTAAPTSEAHTVRQCELLAFVIADAGLPAPRITAWLVAIIEFVGGGLILVGLFSRLSALGLAAVMGGAIKTTSLLALQAHPYIYGMPMADYQRVFLQVSLLALALGVLFAGPGGLSLDRAIFGRAAKPRAVPRSGGGGS